MIEKFLDTIDFDSYEDFMQNFHIKVPENFNFAYDVVDEWARIEPHKKALLWTNDKGLEHQFTFADVKHYSDQAASFFQQLGIGHGDMVMLIMKRRYQWWWAITALHKLGAVAIPATHLLTPGDIVYRCNAATIKAIVSVGDDVVIDHIVAAQPQCPSVKVYISTGPRVPQGWYDFDKGLDEAPAFHRPEHVNTNDDTSLMYFTSGTSGEPKMVAHDFLYPLGHIITAKYWHNLDEHSLHFTLADTGWGKAVWGKYYGQWIVGCNVFVYDFDKFKPVDVLEMIHRYLPLAVNEPTNPVGRDGMAVAQYVAGMAFSNVGLGVDHGMAHPLSALHDVPHGVACAMLLPTVMRFNAPAALPKYVDIAKAVGVYKEGMTHEEAADAACTEIENLSKLVGIPAHLSELGITEKDIDALADQAIEDVCTPGNPRHVTREDIVALYKKIL